MADRRAGLQSVSNTSTLMTHYILPTFCGIQTQDLISNFIQITQPDTLATISLNETLIIYIANINARSY